MYLLYLLLIIIVLDQILNKPNGKSSSTEYFDNHLSNHRPNKRNIKKIYNKLERNQYHLKEDCIFNSSCITEPNNHSFVNFGRPVHTSIPFYSTQVIRNIPEKTRKITKNVNKITKAYKESFHSKKKPISLGQFDNTSIQHHLQSSDKLKTTNRKMININPVQKHTNVLYSSLV
jgi:hypothetical protein